MILGFEAPRSEPGHAIQHTLAIAPDDDHNRALVHNVHPVDWTNPTPAPRYDLVVLGAGTAGLVSAVGAAGLGAKVAIIERQLMGGDCLNFGCVPSKAILRAARAVHAVRRAEEYGVHITGSVDVRFGEIMTRMRRLRAGISEHDSVHRLSSLGIDVFLGEAQFVTPDAVHVDEHTLRFSRAIIATGSRAAVPNIPGLNGLDFLINETVFSLTELPRRLVVIGAGPIGCELSQAFASFGSKVTLIGRSERVLSKEDADVSEVLTKRFEREGIALHLGVKISRLEQRKHEKVAYVEVNGRTLEVIFDQILVATGRVPNLSGLGLERAGIEFDESGVRVDERLATNNPKIYAAGDICSAYKFTHAADAMARIALQNALFFGRQKANALVIPWCTYTEPEIAHVGISDQEARSLGSSVISLTVPLSDVDRTILDGDEGGFSRIHVEKRSGRILGATLVAAHAGELISEISLAMTANVTLRSLSKTIHPYPTQAEVWKRLADTWNRTRLTTRLRTWLTRYFTWRRALEA